MYLDLQLLALPGLRCQLAIVLLIIYYLYPVPTNSRPIIHKYPTLNLRDEGENTSTPSYAPIYVDCPSKIGKAYTYTRPARLGVSADEASYIKSRQTQTTPALLKFLLSLNETSELLEERRGILQIFNVSASDAATRLPNTAIAFSGGGYRAMLNGASIFRAIDAREENTIKVTNSSLSSSVTTATTSVNSISSFTGLLQGMNYMSGLSGGSWLIGSIALNDFCTVDYLRKNKWNLEYNLSTGVKGKVINHLEKAYKYLQGIRWQVEEKKLANFFVTITDYWSLALGRQFLDKDNGGTGGIWRWNNVNNRASFKEKFEMPFPIIVANEREPSQIVVERNSTIFEITPLEFGSWDREGPYFARTRYLGTNMSGGMPREEDRCVEGFDMGNFIMGTSSSLFSEMLSKLGKKRNQTEEIKGVKGFFVTRLIGLLSQLAYKASEGEEDIAYYPNPFQDLFPETNNLSTRAHLSLADGGLDKQNIPLWPLIQPPRNLDFILAVDSTADTDFHWPNGSSLVATQSRIQNLIQRNWPMVAGIPRFPSVPNTTKEFVQRGLNLRPTFFGCNGSSYDAYPRGMSETGGGRGKVGPLIVYLPNCPWRYYTNTSTYQLDYIQEEIDGFFENGKAQLDEQPLIHCPSSRKGHEIREIDFKTCVGCAILQRSKERIGLTLGETCGCCFREYCWPANKEYSILRTQVDQKKVNTSEPWLMAKDKRGLGYQEVHEKIVEERRREGVGDDEETALS